MNAAKNVVALHCGIIRLTVTPDPTITRIEVAKVEPAAVDPLEG